MKRQHVLVLVAVVVALAATYTMMKPSPKSEVDTAASNEVVVPAPTEGNVVETEQPAEAPKTASVPTDTVVADESNASNEETSGEGSEALNAEIKQNLAAARKVLQQRAVVEKAKPEEVHHMPKATLDAAKRLGEIAELEAQHPEQAESFKEFYLECARDENTMTVTRAQCLNKYMKAAKVNGSAQKDFLADYPEEVVRLVEALQ